MNQKKSECACCKAEFGIKFETYTCASCNEAFCLGHIIPRDYLVLHNSVELTLGPQSGLCYPCLFQHWGKTTETLTKPAGILGRARSLLSKAVDFASSLRSSSKSPTELIKIAPQGFEAMIRERAWAVFKHQRDVPFDFLVADMVSFMRAVAVSHGRRSESDLNLKDIYQLVDWLRTHPNLPPWLHGVSWQSIETSQVGIGYFYDVFHLTSTALAMSNPATGIPWAAYHIGDRVVEQKTGDGLLFSAYAKIREKFGLNVNPRMALVVFLAGLFVLQLYRRGDNQAPGK